MINISKIDFNKNLLKRFSNNLAKKNLYIDEALEDNFYRNKIFELFLKNSDIMNNNINQINNFLNININLGNNKYNGSSSSENEEGCKNNQNVNNISDISSNKSEEEKKIMIRN